MIARISSLVLAALLLGCGGPLVPSDYQGEPLLTLTGSVENPLELAPEESSGVYLAWRLEQGIRPISELIAEGFLARTGVEPTFPSSFTLELFTLPPESSISARESGARIAVGQFLMVSDAQMEAMINENTLEGTFGYSNAAVVFVPDTQDLEAFDEEALVGLQHGFNLLMPPADTGQAACLANVDLARDACHALCDPNDDDFDCGNACEDQYVIDSLPCLEGSGARVVPVDTPITIELTET